MNFPIGHVSTSQPPGLQRLRVFNQVDSAIESRDFSLLPANFHLMPLPIRRLRNCATFAVYNHLASTSPKLSSTMASNRRFNPTETIHWILDWDGTITQHDTLDALVSIAASAKPDLSVLQEWERVSKAYMSDYTSAMETLVYGGNLPTTLEEEKRLLQALSRVEQASLDRVSSAGIFAGLTRQLIAEGATKLIESKKVELRTGFAPFLHLARSRSRDRLDLLSVNWSRYFIESCLAAAKAPVHNSSIYANELDGIRDGQVSRGYIGPKNEADMSIVSSGDKLSYLNQLRRRQGESVVYIGDSWTDIECLLDAELGICIRDKPLSSSQKKLSERLESLDVHCPHLSDWRQADERQVVWARDFTEVKQWVEAHNAGSF